MKFIEGGLFLVYLLISLVFVLGLCKAGSGHGE